MNTDKLVNILQLSDLELVDSARILTFSQICHDLIGAIEEENQALFLRNGPLDMAKADMKLRKLKKFEQESVYVFQLIREKCPDNQALVQAVISIMNNMKKYLHINTEMHFSVMKENNHLAQSDYFHPDEQENRICH